jgi:hypothetical protein
MAGNGWSNQITTLIIIEAGTGFTGIFLYDPAPGTGNLVESIAASAGIDPYGNTYAAGFASYNNTDHTTADLVNGTLSFTSQFSDTGPSYSGGTLASYPLGATIDSGTTGATTLSSQIQLIAQSTTNEAFITARQQYGAFPGNAPIVGSILQNDDTGDNTSPKFVHTGFYTGTVSGATGQVKIPHAATFTPTFALFTPVAHFSQGNWDSTFGTNGLTTTQAQLQAYVPGGAFVGSGTAVEFFAMFMA